MTRFALAAALVVAAGTGIASAQSAHQRLARLADESYSGYLDLFPQEETLSIGPGARQAKLGIYVTAEHQQRERRHYREVLAKLASIPSKGLSPTDAVTRSTWRACGR